MRERLARSICEADCGCITENELARCYDLADAVLSTMREPTEAMISAAVDNWNDRDIQTLDEAMLQTWQTMIDAAGE
jgi:hypothetical protein